jgi:1-acyl-sn-glycerol-3-phosphate acyltransferase
MQLMTCKIGFRMSWLVANDLKFPLSFLASISNGIPIDRTNPNADTVDQVIEYFNTHDKVALMIAPEGRLKRVDYWRSGFYYIAMGAKAPVVPGNMDYKRKVIALTDAFYPTGDLVADFEPLKPFFGGATARFPERVGPIEVRVRSEAMRERLKARGMRDS